MMSIRAACRGRWRQIFSDLAPALTPALENPGRHVPCPVHGGKDGLRAFPDVEETGGTVCNTCGVHPNGLMTLMWINNMSVREALTALQRWVSGEPTIADQIAGAAPQATAPSAQRTDAAIAATIRRVLAESVPLTHRDAWPARAYLALRGITGITPLDVWCHPALGYYDKDRRLMGRFPALVTPIRSPSGEIVTLHRTYLAPNGSGKALVPAPKKTMARPPSASLKGAAMRIAPAASVLGIAEGIETALSVWKATGIPCWAAGCDGQLARWEPPVEVQRVLVFADRDAKRGNRPLGAGQQAAFELASRMWAEGRKVTVFVPEGADGTDWNDVLIQRGARGFPRIARETGHELKKAA